MITLTIDIYPGDEADEMLLKEELVESMTEYLDEQQMLLGDAFKDYSVTNDVI